MRKLFYILTVAALLIALFAAPCYAEEGISVPSSSSAPSDPVDISAAEAENAEIPEGETDGGAESAPNTAVTPEDFVQSEKDAFLDQLIGIVTNGEIWAKIGVSLVAVLALIVALRSTLGNITSAIEAVKSFVAGKATKEETEAVIKSATSDLKDAYNSEFSKMSDKYASLEAKYDRQTAVLSLLSLQLVKSPNARVQIMDLISKAEDIGGNAAEVVAAIEAEIEAADAAEVKPDTPALDAIKASIATSADTAAAHDPADNSTAYIALG